MSKSLGNVIEPKAIVDGGKGGVDMLRYWSCASDLKSDIAISPEILGNPSRSPCLAWLTRGR